MVEQLAMDYPDHFAALTMHVNGDGFETLWGQHRLDVFYGLPALVPTFMVNASENCRASDYRYCVEQQLNQPTDVTLELSGTPVGGAKWDVTARVCLEGSGSRSIRLYTAATLDDYPNPPSYSTNTIKQDAFQSDITVTGGGCQNVTTRIDFDPESMLNSHNIVIIAWAQAPAVAGPTAVYQAGIMRWPFPAGSQLTTIDVTPSEVTINVGEEIEFTAVGKDQSGGSYPLENPDWSLGQSGTGAGSFDPGSGSATTTFTATAAGSRQIFCQEVGVTGGAIVTIREAAQLSSIEIDPASTSIDIDGSVVFSAVGKDQYGEDFPLTDPGWSVSGDGDGIFDPTTGTSTTFTASYPGSSIVTCAQGDVSATAELEIIGEAPRLETIGLSPATTQTRVGDETEFVATGSDQYGRAFELVEPTWRIEGDGEGDFDPSDGSATTTFTATGDGSAQIICSEDGIEGAAAVEIAPPGLPAPRKAGRRVAP